MNNRKRRSMPLQKFHFGDMVKIDDELPEIMGHFRSGEVGIVDGSYYDKYPSSAGGRDTSHTYGLHFSDGGYSSWYYESQLTLISRNEIDKLEDWRRR